MPGPVKSAVVDPERVELLQKHINPAFAAIPQRGTWAGLEQRCPDQFAGELNMCARSAVAVSALAKSDRRFVVLFVKGIKPTVFRLGAGESLLDSGRSCAPVKEVIELEEWVRRYLDGDVVFKLDRPLALAITFLPSFKNRSDTVFSGIVGRLVVDFASTPTQALVIDDFGISRLIVESFSGLTDFGQNTCPILLCNGAQSAQVDFRKEPAEGVAAMLLQHFNPATKKSETDDNTPSKRKKKAAGERPLFAADQQGFITWAEGSDGAAIPQSVCMFAKTPKDNNNRAKPRQANNHARAHSVPLPTLSETMDALVRATGTALQSRLVKKIMHGSAFSRDQLRESAMEWFEGQMTRSEEMLDGVRTQLTAAKVANDHMSDLELRLLVSNAMYATVTSFIDAKIDGQEAPDLNSIYHDDSDDDIVVTNAGGDTAHRKASKKTKKTKPIQDDAHDDDGGDNNDNSAENVQNPQDPQDLQDAGNDADDADAGAGEDEDEDVEHKQKAHTRAPSQVSPKKKAQAPTQAPTQVPTQDGAKQKGSKQESHKPSKQLPVSKKTSSEKKGLKAGSKRQAQEEDEIDEADIVDDDNEEEVAANYAD